MSFALPPIVKLAESLLLDIERAAARFTRAHRYAYGADLRAQGFPADYIIDRTASGKPLTISASVRMVGNSVSPPPLCALARANLDPVQMPERIAA